MANLYYDIRVDIQKDTVIDSGLRFTQGDSKVIYLRIAVTNGGVKFDASNTTPSVCFVKPDGTYVVGTPVETGDFWVYQILGNELQSAGKVLCDIKFTYSSGRISSSKFTFIVEKDTTISNAEASTSYIAPMQELLGEMTNIRDQGFSVATLAESWAIGGTSTRTNEDYDNSKYYAEQAEMYAQQAQSAAGVGIATTTTAGIVRPDGSSITVDPDGTIHASGGSANIASTSKVGVVKPDGATIDVKPDGTISVPTATNAQVGLVKPDGYTTSINTNGEITVIGGGGGGGQGGSVVYVYTTDFIGKTVSLVIRDDVTGESELITRVFDSDGKAEFNVMSVGSGTVTVVDSKTYTQPITITSFSVYKVEINRFSATIKVSVETGAKAYATVNGNSYFANSVSGVATISVGETGMYTITAEKDGIISGDTKQVVISAANEVKNTSILFASISIVFDGTLIASVTDGTMSPISINSSTSPYRVIVPSLTTYTITGTLDGDSFETSVTLTAYEEKEITISVSNDYEKWLETADFTVATYPTLEDLLADETAVRKIFTLHASNDFLVTWLENDSDTADTILNNKNCQKWINISNYALDTLQANATVKALMDSIGLYGYGELIEDGGVMKPKGLVPKMTADNAPYGNVTRSGAISNFDAFNVFKGYAEGTYNTNKVWSTSSSTNQWLQYEFATPTKVSMMHMVVPNNAGKRLKNFKLLVSNDGTFTDLSEAERTIFTGITRNDGSGSQPWSTVPEVFKVDESKQGYYKFYRLLAIDEYSSNGIGIDYLQFYGRTLSVSVPKMSTDNFTPYGEASCKSLHTGYTSGAFNAFDRDTTLNHEYISEYVASGVTDEYIQYDFKKPVVIKQFVITNRSVDGPVRAIKDFDLVGTDDKGHETVIQTYTNRDGKSVSTYFDVDDANAKPYFKYKLHIKNAYADYQQIILAELQFYGLDYSEKEFGDSKVKYIYDHGVEFDMPIGTTVAFNSSYTSYPPNKKDSYIELDTRSKPNNSEMGVSIHTDLSKYKLSKAIILDGLAANNQFGYHVISKDAKNWGNTNNIQNTLINELNGNAPIYSTLVNGEYDLSISTENVRYMHLYEWWLEEK